MRLAYIPNDSILNMYEIPSLSIISSAIMLSDLLHDVILSSNEYNTYISLFNLLIDPATQQTAPLSTQALAMDNIAPLAYFNVISQFINYAQIMITDIPMSNAGWLPLCYVTALNWNLLTNFVLLYTVIILWYGITSTLSIQQKFTAHNIKNIYLIMFIWIFASLDKLESTEEALSLAILWPWCFLIVFTHLTALSDHTILFGFSEWGLPVTYGLIMLAEHCWTMGTYLFIYLSGTRGHKFSLLSALEDAVALLILIARVLLQAIRGVIVGMFHFISRELLWNMSKYWSTNSYTPASTAAADQALTTKWFVIDLLLSSSLAAGSFIIITSIMFLQLIFLLVSVWLFCKCWFISWRKC